MGESVVEKCCRGCCSEVLGRQVLLRVLFSDANFVQDIRLPFCTQDKLTSTPSQRISIIQTPLNKLKIQNPGCYWTTLFKNLLGIMIFAKFKKGLSCFGHCLSLWMFSCG